MSKYSDTDHEAFARISEAIINWRDATIDIASVITEAKAREIWKLKYDSWTDFLQIECGITQNWASKLIVANKVMLQIANSEPPKPLQNKETDRSVRTVKQPSVVSVSAALELAKVPETQRPAVLAKAATSGPVTAKSISTAATPAPSSAPDIRLDAIGRVIPAELVPDWERAEKVASRLRSCASEIKVTVERGLADKDIIFAEITNPTISEAASLHYTLSQITPHSVCPACQGRNRLNCQLCRRRGWISKYLYNSPSVSAETKAILEKAVRK